MNNPKQVVSKFNKIFIWFIFIYSSIALFDCFFFLEFWYSKRNGLQNGLHIFNSDYSIVYWFSHISYLSAIAIVTWSGFEVAGLYDKKWRPRFVWRYTTVMWSVIMFLFAGLPIPFNTNMQERWSVIITMFNGGEWLHTGGIIYSLLDFFQFVSIHLILPILLVVYVSVYKHNEVSEDEVKKGLFINIYFMLAWWISVGSLTLLGMNGPYWIINWNKDSLDMKIYLQILVDLFGFCLISTITYFVLKTQYMKSISN